MISKLFFVDASLAKQRVEWNSSGTGKLAQVSQEK